jgi:hypothetical protein
MGMLSLLLGRKADAKAKPRPSRPAPPQTEFAASQLSPSGTSNPSVRKDLLKVVLRETLLRNGIPQGWVGADMLRTASPRREQGLHVRFLVRRWEPRLLPHAPALERDFAERLVLMDPLAADWLMGFSWQFALEDDSACPPLPHPGSWTAPAGEQARAGTAHETAPGDIIEGPVVIARPLDQIRADLDQLMALRDADIRKHAQAEDGFAATTPASL